MTVALANPTSAPRPLDELAAELRHQHEAAVAAFGVAVEHALNAGRLLLEAKAQVPHGEWLAWLERNLPASARTAQQYMQLARRPEDARALAHLGIQGALRELAAPRPARKAPIGQALRELGSPEGAIDELRDPPSEPRRVSLSKGVGGQTWRNIQKAHKQADQARRAGDWKLEVVRDVVTPDALAAEDLRLAVDYYRQEIAHREEAIEELLELAKYMDRPRR
jgi:Protein of unknown function (DUF3102)